jgi:hypothetical protein
MQRKGMPMKNAQVGISILLVLLLLFVNEIVRSQACDQCPRPSVAVYDVDVQVPRPTIPDSLLKYADLFWPGAWARGYLTINDASLNCVTWMDVSEYSPYIIQQGVSNMAFANLPPSGPVEYADYILSGTVSGANGNFTFTLTLETGWSREVVFRISQPFTYGKTSGQSAGEGAAAALIPLFQTIRTYEVNKRNSGVMVAIRDEGSEEPSPGIDVSPRQRRLGTGESTEVDVTMIDCDGMPLSNREITFGTVTFRESPLIGTTGGTVNPQTVTTDDNGHATVTFTASGASTVGDIHAWYVHNKPSGAPALLSGQAAINITPRMFHVAISCTKGHQTTFVNSGSAGWEHRQDVSQIDVMANFIYEIRNPSENPDSLLVISLPPQLGDTVRSFSAFGRSSNSSIEDDWTFFTDGTLDGVSHWETRETGKVRRTGEDHSFYLKWLPAHQYLGDCTLMLDLTGVASDRLYSYGYGWAYDSNPIIDSAQISMVQDLTEKSPGIVFKKTTGRYKVRYDTTAIQTDNTMGTQYDRLYWWVDITITTSDYPTAVRGRAGESIPEAFSLSYNYPNPFNPSTTIRYGLPHKSQVSLMVYNTLGQLVSQPVSGEQEAGYHEVRFDASGLSSGVYFYRLQAGSFVQTRKLLLLR